MTPALPLAKYHQVYLVLREQIEEGRFAQGLPGELSLTRQFGVGRVTVRRALEQLSAEGLIVREAGRGTWPTRPAGGRAIDGVPRAGASANATRINGLLQNIVDASRGTTVRIVEWRNVEASEAVAGALRVPVGAPVRKIVRVRSTAQGPLSHITAWVPRALLGTSARRALASKPMLRVLEEAGVELGRAQQTVSARQADSLVAAELGVAIGTALLAVRRLVFDTSERPVQWLHGLYRPDRYEYRMEVSQVGSIDARISVKERVAA